MTTQMHKRITSHSNFSESDYKYLSGKGYTDREILSIWNRKEQTKAVHHAKQFDAVGYFRKGGK